MVMRCEICGKETKTRICIVCGKHVCATHFYPMLTVCADCVSDEMRREHEG
ncbi:MAG: hypothetical protein QMC85_02790 [Methanocellales archaeon]|nr:hypothetical protein [Methanocellales archaeon]MDI6859403.1 hypothetical protein [Methanocellales archaeon]MDI6903012.1 hypothetical protein [Methanocellales archaeon]